MGGSKVAASRATRRPACERDAAFDRFAWLAAKATGASIALLALADEQRQPVWTSASGLPEPWQTAPQHGLLQQLCARTLSAGIALRSDADASEPEDGWLGSYASVPLLDEAGHARGALCVLDERRYGFTDDDVRALTELAALANAQAELRAGPARGQVAAPPALGIELLRADGATPLPLDELPFIRALRGETVAQAEVFVRWPEQPHGRWHRINATPLRDADGVVRGTIVVDSDVTEQRLAQERLSQMVHALRMLALLDELTGLHNRRGFTALAEHQIKIANQTGRPLLIFFADLDHLKLINDTFGHEAGDQALRDAARLLRATFRESDLYARIGGDEFVVLACDATLGDANLFAARLEAALHAYNALSERRFKLSISTGATAYDPRAPERLEALLQRADAAMYRVKQQRRSSDRVGPR